MHGSFDLTTGESLAIRRRRLRLTQEAFAQECGLRRETINRLERGTIKLTGKIKRQVERALFDLEPVGPSWADVLKAFLSRH